MNYLFLFLLAVAIVACGNRQTMFSVFVSVCYYLLYSKNVRYRLPILLSILMLGYGLYHYADLIFGSLSDVKGDFEDLRLVSVIFFWGEVTQNWISFLFGNGLGHKSSLYGNEVYYIGGQRAIFSDVGILGTMYLWGTLYVLAYYVLAFRMFLNRHLSVHLKSVLLSFLIASPIAPFLFEISGMLLQGLLFYLCDVDIYNNKLKKNESRIYRG